MLARKMPISLLVTAICRAPLLGNAYPIEPEPTKFHLLDRTSLRWCTLFDHLVGLLAYVLENRAA